MLASANHRTINALFAVNKINRVPAKRAEEIVIDSSSRAASAITGDGSD